MVFQMDGERVLWVMQVTRKDQRSKDLVECFERLWKVFSQFGQVDDKEMYLRDLLLDANASSIHNQRDHRRYSDLSSF